METGAITKIAATAAAPTRAIMELVTELVTEPRNPLFFFIAEVSFD
jgi:hypothetical protein